MNDFSVPPLADLQQLPVLFRDLGKPLYEMVNQDPDHVSFPSSLNSDEQEAYRRCLEEALGRSITVLETVSCRRTPGIAGRSGALMEYSEAVLKGEQVDGDLFSLLSALDERTQDTEHGSWFAEIPPDVFERALWFYGVIQQRPALPPLPARKYGQTMCRVLAMGMGQPHQLIAEIYPFLLRHPPLGFRPLRADIYRVLVA